VRKRRLKKEINMKSNHKFSKKPIYASNNNPDSYSNSSFISNNLTNSSNIGQGSIELFSQNYSEINRVPINIFLANPCVKKYQRNIKSNELLKHSFRNLFHSVGTGISRSELSYDNRSQSLKYSTKRKIRVDSILKIFTPVLDRLLNKKLEQRLDSYIHKIQMIRTESCYISGFVPMTKCKYQIKIAVATDSSENFIKINSPGANISYQILDDKTIVLKSYYQNNHSESKKFKKLLIENFNACTTFDIYFDGFKKMNTIYYGKQFIETPFYNLDRQNLPYPDFSNGWIKFTNYIVGSGKFIDVKIIEITQTAERYFITAIGDSKSLPYGLDGPHPYEMVNKGISYMKKQGNRGTIWFDIIYINDTEYVDYLRNLVRNESWEVGIHYSKSLSDMPLEELYELMEKEFEIISQKIGKKPVTWCSLRNKDNNIHVKYGYDKFGMIWRNGETGVNGEFNVGNLDDQYIEWWNRGCQAGIIHPVFTHRTDEDPAISWSISYSKFIDWIDTYNSKNIDLIPFGEWWKINSNTYQASFKFIKLKDNFIIFTAHTNSYPALINVNIKADKDTEVYDETTECIVKWDIQNDKSIVFWIEDEHTYRIKSRADTPL
jgi:hypothetical protein